jgi:hypothetical protein
MSEETIIEMNRDIMRTKSGATATHGELMLTEGTRLERGHGK